MSRPSPGPPTVPPRGAEEWRAVDGYVQVRRFGSPWEKVLRLCAHERVVPVESCVTGVELARLCLDCDLSWLVSDD